MQPLRAKAASNGGKIHEDFSLDFLINSIKRIIIEDKHERQEERMISVASKGPKGGKGGK